MDFSHTMLYHFSEKKFIAASYMMSRCRIVVILAAQLKNRGETTH